jgi:RNA polymerase sigma-70 factor (ECF subfamily)
MENQHVNNLIRLSLRNDRKAFRQIVEAYQDMIFSVSFKLLGNNEDARDCTQDAFIRIWLHLKDFNPEQKFSTWAYRIAVNICIDKLKRQKIKTINFDKDLTLNFSIDDPEIQLSNKELSEIIVALTNELSYKQKVVFTLRYLEDLDVEEIKEITGMSAEKIKSNLYLAKQTIRKKLEKY